tara:strand:+ start:3325 stop:3909 length:585 start_codon:yes stop_codon:yes gene_type:complete
MKLKIFNFEAVTSTNDEAIALIKEKNKKRGYVNALRQTKGRGTHGKNWISDKGNLFSSIFFPLEKNYPTFDEFSIINPVLISEVIKYFCKKQIVNLKFPNDILVNKKKICGILQEVITLKNKRFIIIGIGLNIVSSPSLNEKYKATNIFFETLKKPHINEIINLIILSYEEFFKNIELYEFNYFKKKSNLMATS